MRVIYLGPRLLRVSSDLTRPALPHGANLNGRVSPLDGGAGPIWSCSGWGLPSYPITRDTGELLPRLFTLTHRGFCLGVRSFEFGVRSQPPNASLAIRNFPQSGMGGIFSVALSLPRRPAVQEVGAVRVTDHPVLWSSDFPPPTIPSPEHQWGAPLSSPSVPPFSLSLSILL